MEEGKWASTVFEGTLVAAAGERDYSAPLWISLTPKGQTMVVIYPGESQELLAEKTIETLGEPIMVGRLDEFPENITMLFPHQRLPRELMEMAEQMTDFSLLEWLEAGKRPSCPRTLGEALQRFGEEKTEANLEAMRPFVQHYTKAVGFTVSERGEVGEKGHTHEYVTWVPENQELRFNTLVTL